MRTFGRSILSFAFVFVINTNGLSQHPDKIIIKMKDTIRTLQDCVISITLSRIDHQPFLFPVNYYISEKGVYADLVFIVEKLENGKFTDYSCNKFLPEGDWKSDTLHLAKYKQLTLTDHLWCLECFERGTIRIKAGYIARNIYGVISDFKIRAMSNWATFYAEPKYKIISTGHMLTFIQEGLERFAHLKEFYQVN